MINLSNLSLSFHLTHTILFKNIFETDFYENLCREYPDINNLVKTEDKNSNNLSKFNKYHLNNIDNKKSLAMFYKTEIILKNLSSFSFENFFI